MICSLKKAWPAMIIALLTTTSAVQAEGWCNEAPECRSPCLCGDFSVNVDALIWEAVEEGLCYGAVTDLNETELKNQKFKWNAGVRVGLGYQLPCDCWDVALSWTHFNSKSKRELSLDPGEFFISTWGELPIGGLSGAAVSDHWKLDFNVLDADLGHVICVNDCLSFRPHVGLRAAWIDQKVHIDATGASGELPFTNEVHMKSDYEGIGLRAGLDSEWSFGCGWGLYGSADASILAGESKSCIRDATTFAGLTTIVSQKYKSRACRAATDLAIGLRWQDRFCCDSILLTLQVGWEQHLFFNQNNFKHFVSLFNQGQSEKGDLCLQGWVFSAKVDY